MPEIADTLVIGVEQPDDGYWLGLLSCRPPGTRWTTSLQWTIITTLRTRLTPRHVPDEIVEVPAMPHTLNGNKLEVPIKKLLRGIPLEKALVNPASTDDPEALRWFERFASDRFNASA